MTDLPKRFGPLAMALLFLLVSLVFWGETFRDDYHLSRAAQGMGPAFFPRLVLSGMALMSLLTILQVLRRESGRVSLEGGGRVVTLAMLTVAYGIGILWLGFVIASFLFVAATALALGYRRLEIVLPVAALYALAVWYLFEKVLLIILPASPWLPWF